MISAFLRTVVLCLFGFVCVGILCSPAGWAQHARVREFHFRDFSTLDELVLSGNTPDIAKKSERKKALRLTDELYQSGGAFFHKRISLRDRASFSAAFSFRFHHPMGATDTDNIQGADGIAFVVQTKNNQVGNAGAGIGYEGIKDSVAVEFDTWFNEGADPDGNHIGINVDGELKSLKTKSIPVPFNNGKVWYAWVDYHGPTKRLEVRVSPQKQRPIVPDLVHDIDLVSILKQTDVYVGFTSATGMAGNIHDVLHWRFRGEYKPMDLPSHGSLLVTEKKPHTVTPDQIGIILDASCSMLARVSKKERRIDLAKRILREIGPSFPTQAQVGLLAYGHRWRSRSKAKNCQDTEMVVPFAPFAHETFFQALQKIRPRGDTPIGRALAEMGRHFNTSPSMKWLVVLSDGMETCDPLPHHPFHPARVIRDLQRKGIQVRLNIVGLGIHQRRTHRFLRQIATKTGGEYFDTKRADELKRALESAISVRFVVRDASKKVVASGQVGGASVSVPPGRYTLDVLTRPTALSQSIEIPKQRLTHWVVARSAHGTLQLVDGTSLDARTSVPWVAVSSVVHKPTQPTSPLPTSRPVVVKQGHTTPSQPATPPTVSPVAPTISPTKISPKASATASPANHPPSQVPTPPRKVVSSSLSNPSASGSSAPSGAVLPTNGTLVQKNGIWHYQAGLPLLAVLEHPLCLPGISKISSIQGLFARVSREISLQLYHGQLRGVVGTCLAKAGNSLELSILLARLLQLRRETVRIAQITPTPSERERIFQAFMRAELLRNVRLQQQVKSADAAFAAMLAEIPDLTSQNGTLEIFGGVPSQQKVQQALRNLRAWVQQRPETITQFLLTQLRQVLPLNRTRIALLQVQRRKLYHSYLDRHTWVQIKRDGQWADLDPSLQPAAGLRLRQPEQTLSLDEFLRTLPRHRLQFEIHATFQAGSQQKTIPLLALHTDSASVSTQPISLIFGSTHTTTESQLAGALHTFLKPQEGGIPYQPILWVGTRRLDGQALKIANWLPAKKPDPFGLSGLDQKPEQANTRPELARVIWTVRYLSTQGRSELHQRLILDRVGQAQAKTSKTSMAWTLKPLSLDALRQLGFPRSYRVFTGSLPKTGNVGALFSSPHHFFQTQSAMLTMLQMYMQIQHTEVLRGRSFGYLHTPSLFGFTAGVTQAASNKADHSPGSASWYSAFDIIRQGWLAVLYDDPARTGLVSAAVEHTLGELHAAVIARKPRRPFSVFTVFQQALASKVPLRVIRTEQELTTLALPPDLHATILSQMPLSWIIVPTRPVMIDKQARLAWLRVDPQSGEVSDQADTLAGSTTTEHTIGLNEVLKATSDWLCFGKSIEVTAAIAAVLFGVIHGGNFGLSVGAIGALKTLESVGKLMYTIADKKCFTTAAGIRGIALPFALLIDLMAGVGIGAGAKELYHRLH